MAKLRIRYPTLVWHSIDVDVSDDWAEEILNMDLEQKGTFIEAEVKKEADPREPYALAAALDTDYATIKRIE